MCAKCEALMSLDSLCKQLALCREAVVYKRFNYIVCKRGAFLHIFFVHFQLHKTGTIQNTGTLLQNMPKLGSGLVCAPKQL